jgi:ATP-dependent Clp protease adaptor protein ClpS
LHFADRIHSSGRAIVWSGHKEVAEHYWQQLHGHGLTMSPLERS